MLMMPITPKVMARPMAASSSTEPSDRPYQTFCSACHIASCVLIALIALLAAARTLSIAASSGATVDSGVSRPIASWSPRSFSTLIASMRWSAVASGMVARMAARAWSSAALTAGVGLLGEGGLDRRELVRAV